MAAARLGWPRPGSSVLFLCDLQERFRHSVTAFPQIVAVAARLLQGCRILGVPALVPEQRPEVLGGGTVPELGAQDLPRGCRILGVPALVTEQRPEVLGGTVPELGAQDLPRGCRILGVPALVPEQRPEVLGGGTVPELGAQDLPRGCRILGVPALVTEQRPEVLGGTVPELGAQDLPRVPKSCFSMAGAAAPLLAQPGLQHVLLCGIEAHACVLQTALDLLGRGLEVHVVADAVSSRSQVDRALALARMRQAGAYLSTCESLLLLLLRDSAHPKFRQILALIKEPPPDTGLILGGSLGVLGGP